MNKNIINKIVKGLHEHVETVIVPNNTADRRPEYPYISYNLTGSQNNQTFSLVDEIVPSTNSNFENDVKVIRKEQPYFTLSINTHSDSEVDAYDLAVKVRDWFNFHGDLFFVELNIAVIRATNVGDRTHQIVDDFERRYGFDVRIRAARSIVKRVETIEKHNFNATIN